MSTNILLIETKGHVLKKLQKNSSLQNLSSDVHYMSEPDVAFKMMEERSVGVIVANFENLNDCHDFCLQVRDKSSTFIMIVLLVDEGDIANEIKFAHQILALSCAEKELVAAIDRGIQASIEVGNNPKLATLLTKLDSLPSPPSVYFDLRDLLESPSCNAASLSQLIMQDQALAAKILRVANSGFYAVPRTISGLHQAVSLLGTETLLGLVLATHVFDNLPLPGLNLDNLWKHAVCVGVMSRHIAKANGSTRDQIEASGIAGLLHDLGSLVFFGNHPAEYQTILRDANGYEPVLVESEQEVFGVNHAELGGFVLMLWGLPDSIVNAVKYHHDYELKSTLVGSSPTMAVVITEYMMNYPTPLSDENKQEILDTCPIKCTSAQLDQWSSILDEVMA